MASGDAVGVGHNPVGFAGPETLTIFLLLVLFVPYFLPTIIAVVRHVPNVGSVLVVNLLLGWTLVGWVVALAMAARSVPVAPVQQQFYVGQPQPGLPAAGPAPPAGAGWYADPAGRFAMRWWGGHAWTEHVSNGGGVASSDSQPVGNWAAPR